MRDGEACNPRKPEPFDVWPEHWHAALVFASMQTQWQVGFSGPVGLRYESLPVVMRMLRVPAAEREQAFAGLRIMESEALAYFAERRGNG